MVTTQKFMVYDETQKAWVARRGFANNSLDAMSFDNPTDAYNEIRQRPVMVEHFVIVVLFFNRQLVNSGLY